MAPGPSPSPRPARPVPAIAGLLAAAVLLAACGVVPVIGERTWGMGTTNQLGAASTITVTDASGRIREVVFDPPDAELFPSVTAAPGGAGIDVTWTASACDVATAIRITSAGPGIVVEVATTTDAAGCDAFGVPRAIRLVPAGPLAPAGVTVVQRAG